MEMQTVEMLMARLREDRAKEAFVLDEYGEVGGAKVTLERLLGEMVGVCGSGIGCRLPGKRLETRSGWFRAHPRHDACP